MRLTEFYQRLAGLGFPVAYHHFEEGKSPPLPFMVYRVLSSDNLAADNIAFHKNLDVVIELYTSKKDLKKELVVETFLDNHSLFFNKIETYISSEKLYQVSYTISLEGEDHDQE